MPQRLPLFPLGSVLFPGLVLPLHVFEPRYRRLVQDLLGEGGVAGLDEGGLKGFGVVAVKSGHEVGEQNLGALHPVGCLALLRDVTELDDGRYELVTVGATRFRLLAIDRTAGTPYLTGLVEPYGGEPDEQPDEDEREEGDSGPTAAPAAGTDPRTALLAAQVGARFDAYRDALDIGGGASLPDDPTVLSYLVAAAVVLDVPQRQRLLEAVDTATRLELERELLVRETALVQAFGTVPATDLPETPPTWS